MIGRAGGWFPGRNRYGAFVCDAQKGKIRHLSQLFLTGELWGIDADIIQKASVVAFSKQHAGVEIPFFPSTLVEDTFAYTLTNYVKFAQKTLQLKPPLRLIAGATDVLGYRMAVGNGYAGEVVDDHIIHETTITNFQSQPIELLIPFFEYFWEQCGLDRHQYRQ